MGSRSVCSQESSCLLEGVMVPVSQHGHHPTASQPQLVRWPLLPWGTLAFCARSPVARVSNEPVTESTGEPFLSGVKIKLLCLLSHTGR